MSPIRAARLLVALALLCVLAVPAATASAKPRISGSFALPRGLWPGGFVEHGFVAGPGNTVWMTTETARGATRKPVLMRIAPSGRYVWVATLSRASGAAHVIRISV